MKEMRGQAIQSFDKSASRYNQNVYQKKRQEMLAKLNTQLGVYFLGQINNLHKKAITMFDETLQKELKNPGYNFAESVAQCKKEASEFFLSGAKGMLRLPPFFFYGSLIFYLAILLPETDWSYAHEEELLNNDFTEISSRARAEEFKKMNKALEKQITKELSDPISLELNRPEDDMWHKIIGTYKATVQDGEKLLAKKAKSNVFFLYQMKNNLT